MGVGGHQDRAARLGERVGAAWRAQEAVTVSPGNESFRGLVDETVGRVRELRRPGLAGEQRSALYGELLAQIEQQQRDSVRVKPPDGWVPD